MIIIYCHTALMIKIIFSDIIYNILEVSIYSILIILQLMKNVVNYCLTALNTIQYKISVHH